MALLGASCALFKREDATRPPEDLPGPKIAYEVSIEGVENDARRDLLERSSQLVELRDRPPASLLSLRRRAEQDLERLSQVLQAEGFHSADGSYRIDAADEPVASVAIVQTAPLHDIATCTPRLDGHPPTPVAP